MNIKSLQNTVKKHYQEILVGVLFILVYLPTFLWMWHRWFVRDSYYSHGILVPFVSLFFIWQKREKIASMPYVKSKWDLSFIAIGMLIHLISSVFRVYFTSGFSMILVLVGIVLYFRGKDVLKEICFPLAFLVFMIPAPMVVISNISFKMKLLAAQIATVMLNNMRIPAIREGSIIRMRHAYVVVDDVCSGLRSLISLTALGTLFAYWLKSGVIRKLLLFVSTVPIAILTNVFRVIFLASVSEIWGPQYATGFIHDLSGFLVFVLAFILLYCVSQLLE